MVNGAFACTGVCFAGSLAIDIRSICDAVKMAKIKNLYYRDRKSLGSASVLNYVESCKDNHEYLKLTHGKGDDNVHFQNTLRLYAAGHGPGSTSYRSLQMDITASRRPCQVEY